MISELYTTKNLGYIILICILPNVQSCLPMIWSTRHCFSCNAKGTVLCGICGEVYCKYVWESAALVPLSPSRFLCNSETRPEGCMCQCGAPGHNTTHHRPTLHSSTVLSSSCDVVVWWILMCPSDFTKKSST